MPNTPKERFTRGEIAQLIVLDREMSTYEISIGRYSHANRNLDFYKKALPGFDEVINMLIERVGKVKALDLGCGTGRAAAELAIEREGLVECEGVTLVRHPGIDGCFSLSEEKIHVQRAGNLRFEDSSFNLVMAVGSLDTTGETYSGGLEACRVLKPGGIFLLAQTTLKFYFIDKDTARLIDGAEEVGVEVCPLDWNGFAYASYLFGKPLK